MSRLHAYAQLVRLPALPTALADIGLGVLVTGALPDRWPTALFLFLASGCLYSAGMVWNDFFDVDQDRRERPERPIPSGRVTRQWAGYLASISFLLGLSFAFFADYFRAGNGVEPAWLSTGLAIILMVAIVFYDGLLKRTRLGPVGMGACRVLNVLLGVSVSGSIAWPVGPHLALIVGIYIVGVTWFARTEARTSSRGALTAAAGVMLSALVLALPLRLQAAPDAGSVLFPYLLVVLGFAIGLPVMRALERPTPGPVQAAIKRCLFCLIVLDAVLATALVGIQGLVLLALLIPSLYLDGKRWLYAT